MGILPFMPLQEGYEPPYVELNQEEAILDICHPSECVLLEESKMLAEMLILRCVLKPLHFGDKGIKVRLISEGEVLDDTPLYRPSAKVQLAE